MAGALLLTGVIRGKLVSTFPFSRFRGMSKEVTAPELAARMITHMPGWVVSLPREGEWWADLVRGDGATIRVRVGGFRAEGRVTFLGMWPKFRDGTIYSGGTYESITCGITRTPDVLVKEINRRLLPSYNIAYEKALTYVRDHDSNEVEAELVAGRVADAIGATVGKSQYRRGDGVPIHHEPECIRRLVIQPAYKSTSHERPMTVNFEVHGLDPETAATVLSIIKESEERQRVEVQVRVEAEVEPVYEEAEELVQVRARSVV